MMLIHVRHSAETLSATAEVGSVPVRCKAASQLHTEKFLGKHCVYTFLQWTLSCLADFILSGKYGRQCRLWPAYQQCLTGLDELDVHFSFRNDFYKL